MSSKKTSKIWEHFNQISNGKAECKICKTKISNSNGSTGAMINHIKTIHGIMLSKSSHEDGDNGEPVMKKQKTINDFMTRCSQQEIVTKLAVVDGISIRAITRSNFIRESIAKCTKPLPKNESDVMGLIHKSYEEKKAQLSTILIKKLKRNRRFSITLDEWTSIRMKRYVNINLHDAKEKEPYNLGLVRIFGSCYASDLVDIVKTHLENFNISFEKDIVASTCDGAPMMIKYGRESPAIYQLCFNHGIHLAVCDTLYKKNKYLNWNIYKMFVTTMIIIMQY